MAQGKGKEVKKTPKVVEPKKAIIEKKPEAVVVTGGKSSIESLISTAINNKVPVETLERLMIMRRELREEQAKIDFDIAMSGFQGECPIITKGKTAGNNNFSYKFASLDMIVKQVRATLAKHGFSYTFNSEKANGSIKTICNVKHISGHTETSIFEITVDTGAKMNNSQKDGSASTYGKRYAFCNAFGILTGDEDDDAGQVEQSPPNAPRAPYAPSQDAPAPIKAYPKAPQTGQYGEPIKVYPKAPAPAKVIEPILEYQITMIKYKCQQASVDIMDIEMKMKKTVEQFTFEEAKAFIERLDQKIDPMKNSEPPVDTINPNNQPPLEQQDRFNVKDSS